MKRRGKVATAAQVELTQPQAKECLEPSEAGKGKEWILHSSVQRERGPAGISILNFWQFVVKAPQETNITYNLF